MRACRPVRIGRGMNSSLAHGAYPARRADLLGARPGHLRGPDDVRLPAAPPLLGPGLRPTDRREYLPRRAERVPVLPADLLRRPRLRAGVAARSGRPTIGSMRWRSTLARPVRWLRSARFAMLLCGAALILTFPAANLEFLAWFGLVPGLVLIVRSPTAREGGVRAWWLGAGYLIAALYWMAPEIGPAVPLVAVVFGALWIPFGVAAQKLLRPPLSWPRALAALRSEERR